MLFRNDNEWRASATGAELGLYCVAVPHIRMSCMWARVHHSLAHCYLSGVWLWIYVVCAVEATLCVLVAPLREVASGLCMHVSVRETAAV